MFPAPCLTGPPEPSSAASPAQLPPAFPAATCAGSTQSVFHSPLLTTALNIGLTRRGSQPLVAGFEKARHCVTDCCVAPLSHKSGSRLGICKLLPPQRSQYVGNKPALRGVNFRNGGKPCSLTEQKSGTSGSDGEQPLSLRIAILAAIVITVPDLLRTHLPARQMTGEQTLAYGSGAGGGSRDRLVTRNGAAMIAALPASDGIVGGVPGGGMGAGVGDVRPMQQMAARSFVPVISTWLSRSPVDALSSAQAIAQKLDGYVATSEVSGSAGRRQKAPRQ